MKKIIATVLAMVMALALCTTAFAADEVTAESYQYTDEATFTEESVVAEFHKAVAAKVNKDGEPTRGFHADSAADALMHACSQKGIIDPAEAVRGCGAWSDDKGGLVLHLGDMVWIEESKPISKLKRWTVVRGEQKKTA